MTNKVRPGIIQIPGKQVRGHLADSEAGDNFCGIVSSIASEQFAKNPPPGRIRRTIEYGPEYGHMDIWIYGYLAIWIFGYLDSGKANGLLHAHNGILCGVAPAGFFFFQENTSPVFCQTKTVNSLFYQHNLVQDLAT